MFINGQITTTNTAVLAVGANENVYFKTLIVHNTSNNDETIYFHLVKNDNGSLGTPDNTNIVEEQILSSKETSEFSPSYPIHLENENDAVFLKSSSDNVVNYFITGFRN